MTIFVAILSVWLMPLFFLILGMAIFYSLRKRDVGVFYYFSLTVDLPDSVCIICAPIHSIDPLKFKFMD